MDTIYDIIIIGAGPAGLTAGLYTSRSKLHTLIIEKGTPGGELMNRDLIENWPGYTNGILGPELGSRMMKRPMNSSRCTLISSTATRSCCLVPFREK